jgi:hypothetical protein
MSNFVFEYPRCSGKHSRSPKNIICLDSNCEERGLICFLCLQKEHKGHTYDEISNYIGAFKQLIFRSNMEG